jgi:hypothetical protein
MPKRQLAQLILHLIGLVPCGASEAEAAAVASASGAAGSSNIEAGFVPVKNER